MSWVTATLLLAVASTTTPSTPWGIRKCCSQGDLMTGFDKCSSLNATVNGIDVDAMDTWWWVGDAAKEGLDFDKVGVGLGTPGCHGKTKRLLDGDSYRLALSKDSTVLLETIVESSTQDEETEVWHAFPPSAFCLDARFSRGKLQNIAILCPCTAELPCVRKCCDYGREFNATSMKCVPVQTEDYSDWVPAFDAEEDEDHRYYHLPSSNPVCAEKEILTMTNATHLGRLVFLRDGRVKSNVSQETFEKDKYCGDHTTDGEEVLLHCMRVMTTSEGMMSTAYGIVFLIGSLALLLVVLISLLLPDMRRKVSGRMALAHNVMLLVAYLSTAALHFVGVYGDGMSTNTCKGLSLVIQFSFLASFFWLNVMCIDIFWVFSGLRPIQGSTMQREKKKFAYYSIYAWGSTSLISIATIATEFGSRDSTLRPAFGEGSHYFFSNPNAMWLFFYGPMAALLAANFCLFIYTAIKIYFAKKATAILHSADSATSKKNKQRGRPVNRLALYVKLFGLMGVTWIFEVVGWAVDGEGIIWFLLDAVNILRAVFIFVIFCGKRSVLDKVRRRLGCAGAREPGTSTYSADTRTTSSNISRTRNATPLPARKGSQSSAVTTL